MKIGDFERRTSSRRNLLWRACLRTDVEEHLCSVLDISLEGAKVQSRAPLEQGTRVKLDIFGICAFKGSVVWCESGQMGVEFAADAEEVRLSLGARAETLGLKSPRGERVGAQH